MTGDAVHSDRSTSKLRDWAVCWPGTSAARAALGLWVFGCLGICGAAEQAAPIPQSEITAMKEELSAAMRRASSVDIRRACKAIKRKVEALLEASPEAPNRYDALIVLFDSQKRLLSLEVTEQNREAIFETCRKLLDAPDEYAESRFEADMLLSEKELAEKDAKVAERIEALEAMLARYRGTSAEWKSLVVGSMIATKLFEFDVEKKISDAMAERFGGDHKVIEFRRKKEFGAQVDAVFGGRYKSQDGKSFVFPNDRLGHQYALYFWSEKTPEIDKHMLAIKEIQARNAERMAVYSFNLDELPDAGQKRLRKLGLDWPALHLPDGRNSSTYQAYMRRDPGVLYVNGQGHSLLIHVPKRLGNVDVAGVHQGVLGGWNIPGLESRLDDPRYLSQLQYLFIGDFLVSAFDVGRSMLDVGSSIPKETLDAIQNCFVIPPFRYRLTQKEALANYREAEKLCADAIKKHSEAPDLWIVRNRRMIALLGMYSLAREPKYLGEAVKEANVTLAMDLPAGKEVIARSCLAKEALRSDGDPEVVLADLIDRSGGGKAPATALASAAVLSIEANARTIHAEYRRRLLGLDGDEDPALVPVYTFLRDHHHRYRNFWASPGGWGYARPQKYEYRNMTTGLGDPVDRGLLRSVELVKPAGGRIKIPETAKGRMLGMVFVEPPASETASSNLMKVAVGFANTFVKHGVNAVMTFICEDTKVVTSLVGTNKTEFQVGLLPDGLGSEFAQRLGILWADKVPNLLLLRQDGTIAWFITGIQYRAFGHYQTYAMGLGIEVNIEKVRLDPGFIALEKGDFRKSLQLFEGYKPPGRHADWWAADRLHARALAHVGLKNWEAALTEVDAALERRMVDFRSGICKCHGLVEMFLTKATVLEKLGRTSEARGVLRRAAAEKLPHAKLPPGMARQGVPIGVYYDWLKKIRLGLETEK